MPRQKATQKDRRNAIYFTGLKKKPDRVYKAGVRDNIDCLGLLPKDAPILSISSTHAMTLWLAKARPDVSCRVSIFSSVTEELFIAKQVASLNSLVARVKSTSDLSLHYPKLDIRTQRLLAYADSSLANSPDLTSQLGYFFYHADTQGNFALLCLSSQQTRRVTRSSMAGEVFTFSDASDSARAIR